MQARPQAGDVEAGGSIAPRPFRLPSDSDGASAGHAADAVAELDRTEVWRHALEDAEVALVARVGLDDTNAAVRKGHS